MGALKNIFATKSITPKEVQKPKEEDVKKIKFTFFESGYGSSKQAEGNHMVFKSMFTRRLYGL